MGAYHYFKSKIFEYYEQKRVEKRFYSHSRFKEKDLALLAAYEGISPYEISRKFLKSRGALSIHAYGETPLLSMEQMALMAEITSNDTVIELGAGRGRAALFLAEYLGCTVIAYEWIPLFCEKMVSSKKLKMIPKSMFEGDFTKATVIYLYGTMLEEDEILQLISRFPRHAKILTVSYPLSEYSDLYQTAKSETVRFPWGKTKVYLNEFAPFRLKKGKR